MGRTASPRKARGGTSSRCWPSCPTSGTSRSPARSATTPRSSRFTKEGYQEPYVAFVKSLTTKPVVSVGRFTSPDTMAAQIRRGIQDFIGAARPSIADPFLPRKIVEGREDEIRECIGCNICRAANNEAVPLRCTQNPTIGEEWRRGWHPERIARRKARMPRAGGRRRSGRAGMRADARPPRLRRHAGRSRQCARRPRHPGVCLAGSFGLGAGARLSRRTCSASCRTSRSSGAAA